MKFKIMVKFMFIISSLLIVSLIAACTTLKEPSVKEISPAEAREMLKDNGTVLLVDVRTPQEYAEGHIEGSVLIPYDQIGDKIVNYASDKSQKIILYCRSGNRSSIAAAELEKLGYLNIYDLGGINDWPYETVKQEE